MHTTRARSPDTSAPTSDACSANIYPRFDAVCESVRSGDAVGISSTTACKRSAKHPSPISVAMGTWRCVRKRPRVWCICLPLDRWSRLLSSRAQHDRWTKARTHKRHARLQDDHSRSPKPRPVPTRTTTWATRGDGCVCQAPFASAELE
jgi:hypothetical protein